MTVSNRVVHALSTHLAVQTHRDGLRYSQDYEHGVPGELICHGAGNARGTSLWFKPDPEIFGESASMPGHCPTGCVSSRVSCLASSSDSLINACKYFEREQSLEALLRRMPGYARPGRIGPLRIAGTLDQVQVEAALSWQPGHLHHIESFANILRTTDHGTHVEGLIDALRGALRSEFPEACAAHTTDELHDRAVRGLHAVVCVRLADPPTVIPLATVSPHLPCAKS